MTPFVGEADRVVVLCYHSVHPDLTYRSVTPPEFEAHLRFLVEHYDVVPFASVLDQARAGRRERPAVAITFDDGYRDNHDHALPALTRHGVPATFFVTAGFVERDEAVMERFCHLRSTTRDRVVPMTWDQVRELRAAGMDVGSHTWSHPNLALMDDEGALDELVRSRTVLEDQLGEEVTTFAFPFGKRGRHFTTGTETLTSQAGYRMVAAVLSRRVRPADPPTRVPRFFVRNDSLDGLRAKIVGGHDAVGMWQEHAPAWLARLVSPEDYVA